MLESVQHDVTGNPFPGLRPFNTNESLFFFGRDGLSDTLLEKLYATRFVAVVGTSGSGKSSLVRAGLLPALRGGFMPRAGTNWRVALFRPINNPIKSLATALLECGLGPVSHTGQPSESVRRLEDTLRKSSLGLIEAARAGGMDEDENLLVIADQFEELYRIEPSPEVEQPKEEAAAFVKLLLEATAQTELPIYVILTMRSDYLGESAQFWGLPEAINRGQFLIPRMDDDERREAIEGPVRVRGARISWPLVVRLLNDAGDDPRQLPILQHALMRTWDYWDEHKKDSEPLDLKHYDNKTVGGMGKALSVHADEAYEELTEEKKTISAKMFKRLTEKGVGKREGRLPATLAEIAAIANVKESEVVPVIDCFRQEGRSFLMPMWAKPLTSQTLIDISHESLIAGWSRLSDWVEDEAYSAKVYSRLVDDAFRYPKEAGLLTNPELEFALKWQKNERPNEIWARRYRTEFGKALDDDPTIPRPDWADPKASEYAVATRYLDLSREAHERAHAKKERQRRKYLTIVSAMALVFFALGVVSSVMWLKADAATKRANDAKSEAVKAGELAVARREEAERAHKLANEEKDKAVAAQIKAEDATRRAEDQKAKAIAAQKLAQTHAKRGNLLEQGIWWAVHRDTAQAVKYYDAVRNMYVPNHDLKKLATFDILIGHTIIDGYSETLDADAGLPYFQRALETAKHGAIRLEAGTVLSMADSIYESLPEQPVKAAEFYDYAADLLGDDQHEEKVELLLRSGRLYYRNSLRSLRLNPRKEQDSIEAVRRYRQAMDLLPTDAPQRVLIALRIGEVYKNTNHPTEATKEYDSAERLANSFPQSASIAAAWVLIGDYYLETKKNNTQALASYRKADETFGLTNGKDRSTVSVAALVGNGDALVGIGKINAITGAADYLSVFRRAVDFYREALDRTPKTQTEKDLQVYAEDSIDELRKWVPDLQYVLINTLEQHGVQAAIDQYRTLKHDNPNGYDFGEATLNSLGYILLRRGKVDEAIRIFQLNVDAFPKAWNTYDSLAEAYQIKGDKEKAILNYEKSIQLNPNNENGKNKLEKLKMP